MTFLQSVWFWYVGLSSIALECATIAALFAALVALVVGAINLFGRRWLTAGQMALLWGLVLVRLVLPVAPSSSWSFQNMFLKAQNSFFLEEVQEVAKEVRPFSLTGEIDGTDDAPVIQSTPAVALVEQEPFDYAKWIIAFWATCGIAITARTLVSNWRFTRHVRGAPLCDDPRVVSLWRACCTQVRMRRKIPIIVFDEIPQPALMGWLRPRLLLPSTVSNLSDHQLKMVMFHELAHVRRWDVAVNWALVVVRAFHWWNPIFWLTASRLNNLREQACDAFVLRTMQGVTPRDYSDLLLTLASRGTESRGWRVRLPASILQITPSRLRNLGVRNRLKALRRAGTAYGLRHSIAVGILVAGIAFCGLTDSTLEARIPQADEAATATNQPRTLSEWQSMPRAESLSNLKAVSIQEGSNQQRIIIDQERITKTYPMGDVIERVAKDFPTRDTAMAALETELVNIARMRSAPKDLKTSKNPAVKSATKSNPAVKTSPAPKSDEDEEPSSVVFYSGSNGDSFVISTSRGKHEQVADAVAAWRIGGMSQVRIECRFITLPARRMDIPKLTGIKLKDFQAYSSIEQPKRLAKLAAGKATVRASLRVEEYVPVISGILDPTQAKRMVDICNADQLTSVLLAPKLTCFSGREVLVSDEVQRPFVTGVQGIMDGTEVGALKPNIAVLREGTRITLRPVVSDDRKRVNIASRLEFSQIGKPRECTVDMRNDPVTIQVPRMRQTCIEVVSDIDDGKSLLVGMIPPDENGVSYMLDERYSVLYVLLTAHIVPVSEQTHTIAAPKRVAN